MLGVKGTIESLDDGEASADHIIKTIDMQVRSLLLALTGVSDNVSRWVFAKSQNCRCKPYYPGWLVLVLLGIHPFQLCSITNVKLTWREVFIQLNNFAWAKRDQ